MKLDKFVSSTLRSAHDNDPGIQEVRFRVSVDMDMMRGQGITDEASLPFWTVFQGDISRDPCRVREITLWCDKFEDHFFFWRDTNNAIPLLDHFKNRLSHLLN